MNKLTGILLHMDFMNAYGLLTACFRLDLHTAVSANRQIKLGYLIVLRIVRIEIVLPVKFTVPGNLTVRCQSHCNGILQNLLVQYRQGTGHSGTNRTCMGIGCSTKSGRTATENLGFGRKLHMNLQTDDCFVFFCHVTLRLLS